MGAIKRPLKLLDMAPEFYSENDARQALTLAIGRCLRMALTQDFANIPEAEQVAMYENSKAVAISAFEYLKGHTPKIDVSSIAKDYKKECFLSAS